MFHSNTERLLDYWRTRKGAAEILQRCRLDPADIAPLLPQVFIAGLRPNGDYQLRLAGQFIVEAHSRARAGDDLLSLWRSDHRVEVRRILDYVLEKAAPVVLTAQAEDIRGDPFSLEIALAPMSSDGLTANRLLGLYQPLTRPKALHRYQGGLRLRGVEGVSAAFLPPRLRLAALHGRLIA